MLPPSAWTRPDLRWAKGTWVRGATMEPWNVRVAGLTFECRPAAGGQVGLFPEHAGTWGWLMDAVRAATERLGRPPVVLSLFAYTGGATLACALAGAQVTHVDASRPAVAWARRNAELSGLAEAPVRWLVDDARDFVKRERRRGHWYDAVILDPPSYGHGEGAWHIDTDLIPLLEGIAALLGPRPAFAVLSAHTPGYDGERLATMLRTYLGVNASGDDLVLRARSGSVLPLGAWAHGPDRGRGSAMKRTVVKPVATRADPSPAPAARPSHPVAGPRSSVRRHAGGGPSRSPGGAPPGDGAGRRDTTGPRDEDRVPRDVSRPRDAAGPREQRGGPGVQKGGRGSAGSQRPAGRGTPGGSAGTRRPRGGRPPGGRP